MNAGPRPLWGSVLAFDVHADQQSDPNVPLLHLAVAVMDAVRRRSWGRRALWPLTSAIEPIGTAICLSPVTNWLAGQTYSRKLVNSSSS